MRKQTLSVKFKNTLLDTPLVRNPVSSVLNKEETLSVQNKVLADNNLEVDLLPHTGGQNSRVSDNMYVFVLNQRKEPLMPTSCRKARLLLKTGKAIVVKRFPFTIQLKYATGENKQKVSCGIDSGYSKIGFSCITEGKELIRGEVELDNFTSKRLSKRKIYRRGRRNRFRYRPPRFLNRKRPEGWLPPSIERRYQTHFNMVKQLKFLLPIFIITVEVGNFDIQKLDNPKIKGKEYSQGNLYNYSNLKSFILSREKSVCQLCNRLYSKTDKWQFHHIIPRSRGGTDKPNNIALLHEKCHTKLHKENLYNKLKKNKQYKESIFMNIIKYRFRKDLDCRLVFGYQTFCKRKELGLEKTHSNDAFVISGGSSQNKSIEYIVKQKRRNNRCLQKNRKGFRPSIRRKRYKLQPYDLVRVDNRVYDIIGSHNLGERVIIKDKENKKKSISVKKVNWYFNNKSLIFKKGECCSSIGAKAPVVSTT